MNDKLREALQQIINLPTVTPDHAHGGVHPPYLEWHRVAAIARSALAATPQADPADGALREALLNHWITAVECNHEDATDTVRCSCSVWTGTPQPTVGDAVKQWIDHLFAQLAAADAAPEPTMSEHRRSTSMTMLDEGRLHDLEQAALHANAHPRSVKRHEGTTEDLAAWATRNVVLTAEHDGDRPVYAVWARYGPRPEPAEEARIIALTGNGPTSEANAWLAALADPETVTELVRGYRGFLLCTETREPNDRDADYFRQGWQTRDAGLYAESSDERTA
jgi:hypothetical protein